MKLHAQNQPYSCFSFWDLKVLIASLGMPWHAWPHSCKIRSSFCSTCMKRGAPQRCTVRSDIIFDIWKAFKNMKNAFYFTAKAIFVLKILKFLSWIFGHVEKRLDLKHNVNFRIYDVITWLTNNCNAYIAQNLKK